MEFGLSTYGLATLAGALSTLSPCVLPLIPILIGSAVLVHRLGPFALAAGLGLSFALVGTLQASGGTAIGLDQSNLRNLGAGILVLFGLILLTPALQARFASAASGVSNAGQGLLERITPEGLGGQFVVGLVLGVLIVSGLDKQFETWVLEHAPDWLVELTVAV